MMILHHISNIFFSKKTFSSEDGFEFQLGYFTYQKQLLKDIF